MKRFIKVVAFVFGLLLGVSITILVGYYLYSSKPRTVMPANDLFATALQQGGINVYQKEKSPIPGISTYMTDRGAFYYYAKKNIMFYGVMVDLAHHQSITGANYQQLLGKLQQKVTGGKITSTPSATSATPLPAKPVSQGSSTNKHVFLRQLFTSIPDNLTLTYPAKTKEKGVINVIGHASCHYCQYFQQHYTKILQKSGFKVRYFFAPINGQLLSHDPAEQRRGYKSAASSLEAKHMAEVYCAADPQQAFSELIQTGYVKDPATITPACQGKVLAMIKFNGLQFSTDAAKKISI